MPCSDRLYTRAATRAKNRQKTLFCGRVAFKKNRNHHSQDDCWIIDEARDDLPKLDAAMHFSSRNNLPILGNNLLGNDCRIFEDVRGIIEDLAVKATLGNRRSYVREIMRLGDGARRDIERQRRAARA